MRGLKAAVMSLVPLAWAMAQAPQPGVVSAGTGNPYQRARQLPARITEFKAEPASIQPGQSVVLSWATEDPLGVTIEPDLGRVTARGRRQLSPLATTTYTLTVQGANGQKLTQSFTVNVAGTTPVASGAETEAAQKEVARTANGHPDLSGVYNFNYRPPGARAGARGASAAELPVLKPGAEKFKVVRGPDDVGKTADCMPLAGPQAFDEPYQFQIVESAHQVAILFGYPGTFRIIPTDGGVHPEDPDPTWMGDSIGHWEGDTLVIDSVGFNDKTEIEGYRHTEALHIVERFRRPSYDKLEYEATLEDPNVFAKPWTVKRE
ncbi:MAG TPA: hypothetical protein VJ732_13145, partial [Bryobacteraceae bacterium]|nr:hypothetical protein [Bryobacteraceae bacterium]